MTKPAAWDPPERIYAPLGAALRKRRQYLGWGVTRAAQELRVSGTSLKYLETGKRRLSLHHYIELCEHLGLDPVEVLAHVVDTAHPGAADTGKEAADGPSAQAHAAGRESHP